MAAKTPVKKPAHSRVSQIVRDIDKEELKEAELSAARALARDVASQFTEDELVVVMDNYQPKGFKPSKDEPPPKARKNKAFLPEYIDNLPDGTEKNKAIRAAAQAAIILGESPDRVAVQYGLTRDQVSRWEKTLTIIGSAARRDRLSDMLMTFIEQEIKSLMAISIVTSKDEWITRQDADTLSQFITAKMDRLLLLLSAFGRADEAKGRYMESLEVVRANEQE